jgi:hypothetical protein
LKELSEEECSLGFDGGEDCWLLLVGWHLFWFLNSNI